MKSAKIIFTIFILACANTAFAKNSSYQNIAVVGDSISTGALSNDVTTLDPDVVWEILEGGKKDKGSDTRSNPTVLKYSKRELSDPVSWIFKNFLASASSVYFNSEENSWASLVAENLGIKGSNVLVAAKNGAKAESSILQIERILSHTGSVAPDVLLLLYSGNDLCSQKHLITLPEQYIVSIENSLDYFFKNATPKVSNGLVVLPAPLNIVQFAKEKNILNKMVPAFGGQMSCGELRDRGYRPASGYKPKNPLSESLAGTFPPTPVMFCPSLFNKSISNSELLSYIGTTSKAYRIELQKLADRMQAKLKANAYDGFQNWKVVYSSGSDELIFSDEDVGNDCFHLSVKGQKRLADKVLKDLSHN